MRPLKERFTALRANVEKPAVPIITERGKSKRL